MRRLLLSFIPLLLFAPTAHAGVASVDEATRTVIWRGTADSTDVNVFARQLDGSADYLVTIDNAYGGFAETSDRCVSEYQEIRCRVPWAPNLDVDGGAGDDRVGISDSVPGTTQRIAGGPGRDQLYGSALPQAFDGGEGDDVIFPEGDPLKNRDHPAGPNDVLQGGPGIDEASYVDSTGPSLSLTLDGAANDGAPGENDLIGSDIENLTGGRVAESTLIGDDGPNVLSGSAASVTLKGEGGNDVLKGAVYQDTLEGGPGDDHLVGGLEDDRLVGGPGRDSFVGDYFPIYPESIHRDFRVGNDLILARDGVPETINCGPGTDTAEIDHTDTPSPEPESACEIQNRPAVVRSSSLRLRGAGIAVVIACPQGGASCAGTLQVRPARRPRTGRRPSITVLASGAYSVPSGRSQRLRVRVGRSGRALLRRARRLRVRVELRAPGLPDPAATRTVTLRG